MIKKWKIAHLSFSSKLGGMFLILFLFAFAKAKAQDPQFTMAQYTPLLINPASAGEIGKYRANLNYRTQWKSLGTPFTTLAGSFDMKLSGFDKKKTTNTSGLGAGIVFLTDKAGTDGVKLSSVNAQVSYRVKVNESSNLGGGLNIGFEQRSFNPQGGKWGSQFNGIAYDPSLASGENIGTDSDAHLDLGGGIQYRYTTDSKKRKWKLGSEIQAGLAAYHLGRIKLSEAQTLSNELAARYTGFVNVQLPIGEKLALCPAFYGNAQGGTYTYIGGTNLKYLLIAGDSFIGEEDPLSLEAGIFLRNTGTFSVDALVNWGAYSIGLAYGFDYSGLKPYSSGRGGFELNLQWIGLGEK